MLVCAMSSSSAVAEEALRGAEPLGQNEVGVGEPQQIVEQLRVERH